LNPAHEKKFLGTPLVLVVPLQDESIKYVNFIAWNYKMIFTDSLENIWKEVVVNRIFLEILRKNTGDFSCFQTTFRYGS
jgi:hypothetical protein